MVSDGMRFLVVLGVVIVGFANGFYALAHFGPDAPGDHPEKLEVSYSYGNILTEMCLWLTAGPGLDLVDSLGEKRQLAALALMWSFIATAYVVLLNLLIAIFNTSYEKVCCARTRAPSGAVYPAKSNKSLLILTLL